MSNAPVLTEIRNQTLVVTLNRPAALNAINSDMLDRLGEVIARTATSRATAAMVITGGGDKSFVCGADIAEMAELTPTGALAFSQKGHRIFKAIEMLDIPVIAAVNGFCLGGGCELSLACDLVYASETARFGQPEVSLGLIPGFGGTQRLARRIGQMQAADLIMSGRMINASEAMNLGLCLDVFPQASLMDEVLKRAETIAGKGPVAVGLAKRVQQQGLQAPLDSANAYEAQAFATLFDSYDAKEGMHAFLEKRAPGFENR